MLSLGKYQADGLLTKILLIDFSDLHLRAPNCIVVVSVHTMVVMMTAKDVTEDLSLHAFWELRANRIGWWTGCVLLGERSQGWHHCLDQTPGKIGLPLNFCGKYWLEQLLQEWWGAGFVIHFCRVGGEQWDSKCISWVGNLDMQNEYCMSSETWLWPSPCFIYIFMLCLVWFLTQSQAPGPPLTYLSSTRSFSKSNFWRPLPHLGTPPVSGPRAP